jgi:hypothetical protein
VSPASISAKRFHFESTGGKDSTLVVAIGAAVESVFSELETGELLD